MPDFSQLFNFIPNTLKELASFLPTKDNHRFNLTFDIIALLFIVCYAFILYATLGVTNSDKMDLVLEIISRIDIAFLSGGVMAFLCWVTTLFKKE